MIFSTKVLIFWLCIHACKYLRQQKLSKFCAIFWSLILIEIVSTFANIPNGKLCNNCQRAVNFFGKLSVLDVRGDPDYNTDLDYSMVLLLIYLDYFQAIPLISQINSLC